MNLKTKETELINRQMNEIVFTGNQIPDNIRISMMKFVVEPYTLVIQYFTCLKYDIPLNNVKQITDVQICSFKKKMKYILTESIMFIVKA